METFGQFLKSFSAVSGGTFGQFYEVLWTVVSCTVLGGTVFWELETDGQDFRQF